MPQQLFKCNYIHSIFEQMTGIAMTKGVHAYYFFNTSLFSNPVHSPLHATLAVATVEIAPASALWATIK